MKNIFKLMGVALMACSLMVACGKDEPEPTPDPEPQGPIVIKWNGAYQTVDFVDAFYPSANSTIHMLEAAKGIDENDSYIFPLFRFGLDLDTDPSYGCALTAKYTYGQGESAQNGNDIAPTEVFDSVAINGSRGDWQMYQVTEFEPGYQFDGTSHTFTGEITIPMFSWVDYSNAGVTLADGISSGAIRTRDLNVKMNAITFELYQQK